MPGAFALGLQPRAAGSGHEHHARAQPHRPLGPGRRGARSPKGPASAQDTPPLQSKRDGQGWCWLDWALTLKQSAHEGQQLGARRDGSLGFGKAGEGRIRWGETSWSSARGQPVDHLRVVAACLLTGQHRGNGLGCPRRHWHREDPLGVPTARRAGRRRRGRAHSHPLLETAAVLAAILVGGHATLQGCNGRRRRDRKLVLCPRILIVKRGQASPATIATKSLPSFTSRLGEDGSRAAGREHAWSSRPRGAGAGAWSLGWRSREAAAHPTPR